jgi:hypothetical protein
MACMISLTSTLEVIELMLKVTFRICLEASFHSKGPRMFVIGLVAKGCWRLGRSALIDGIEELPRLLLH